jgi:hypothetical protein
MYDSLESDKKDTQSKYNVSSLYCLYIYIRKENYMNTLNYIFLLLEQNFVQYIRQSHHIVKLIKN